MIYAIASGKGGTGKTTLSASLAALWDTPVTAVDLDVEEPNLHLFLTPDLPIEEKAYIEVPAPDESKCTLCGKCADICQYKAITIMADTLLVFPEMCHGCGGCLAVCEEQALLPGRRELGDVCIGTSGTTYFMMGRLRIGEAMSPPLMREVKARLDTTATKGDVIIDAPPGVSCPAVCAVMDADCIVLVTEPTPFGFHDFKLAHEAFSPFGIPMGAVINRAGIGDDAVQNYCADKNIPIWAEIPYDRGIAEAYANGRVIGEAIPTLKPVFDTLRANMRNAAGGGTPHA